MKIIIEAEPKEIADLVVEIQSRPREKAIQLNTILSPNMNIGGGRCPFGRDNTSRETGAYGASS